MPIASAISASSNMPQGLMPPSPPLGSNMHNPSSSFLFIPTSFVIIQSAPLIRTVQAEPFPAQFLDQKHQPDENNDRHHPQRRTNVAGVQFAPEIPYLNRKDHVLRRVKQQGGGYIAKRHHHHPKAAQEQRWKDQRSHDLAQDLHLTRSGQGGRLLELLVDLDQRRVQDPRPVRNHRKRLDENEQRQSSVQRLQVLQDQIQDHNAPHDARQGQRQHDDDVNSLASEAAQAD